MFINENIPLELCFLSTGKWRQSGTKSRGEGKIMRGLLNTDPTDGVEISAVRQRASNIQQADDQ